ncbi:uncharacterized protein METZ01_LOCUS113726, partial [marine metagenome]
SRSSLKEALNSASSLRISVLRAFNELGLFK